MPDAYGYNGPPIIESADDLPPGLPKMHYFKCDIEALWSVLVEMPFEQGGFYMRALLAMYRNMEGLPADDNVARMRLGGVDIRTYRRLKEALLAHPKCFVAKPSGRISNARFEEEVTAYVTEFRNRQRAGLEREAKRRKAEEIAGTSAGLPPDFQPTSGQLPGNFRETSAGLPANIGGDLSKKPNENNEASTSPVVGADLSSDPRARVLRTRTRVRDRREEQSINQSIPPRARAHGADEIGADEGPLDPEVATAIRLLAPLFGSETDPDFDRSTLVVTRWVVPFGPKAVLDGAMDYIARREDKSEPRQISENLFGRYVRQAARNASGSVPGQEPVVVVDKSKLEQDDSCWFAEDRLMVANGFEADLLALVGGDKGRLRLTLDKAAASVPIDLRGAALRKVVRGQFARHVDWDRRDERKAVAVERRSSNPADAGAKETQAERIARIASEYEAKKNPKGAQ